MEKQYNVGVIGATGMVGQRFLTLLSGHPWFNVKLVAASPRSAGKRYADAVGKKKMVYGRGYSRERQRPCRIQCY